MSICTSSPWHRCDTNTGQKQLKAGLIWLMVPEGSGYWVRGAGSGSHRGRQEAERERQSSVAFFPFPFLFHPGTTAHWCCHLRSGGSFSVSQFHLEMSSWIYPELCSPNRLHYCSHHCQGSYRESPSQGSFNRTVFCHTASVTYKMLFKSLYFSFLIWKQTAIISTCRHPLCVVEVRRYLQVIR